jgi:pimeloyl-CoA dehydrogenase small subunit
MDFDLNDEQRMLKDSVDRLIKDNYAFETRKKYIKESAGYSTAMWEQYAEMGLLGLPFSEEHGGTGGGAVETMIVMEAMGRGLTLEPYFPTVILGGGLIQRAGNERQKADLLPVIASGELKLAFAYGETQARYDLSDVTCTAKRDADGWILTGDKCAVVHGGAADKLIVTARTSGNRRDADGVSLFVVDAKAAGVSRRDYQTHDSLRSADIKLAGVKVSSRDELGPIGKAAPIIREVADRALAASAAETIGAMGEAYDVTLDYLKTRKQFGAAIGSFQALQHRAVDMMVQVEQARSMAYYATMMADCPDANERSNAIAAAMVQIRRSARFVGQQVVQLHGGIGMTIEYKIGHYFKRITALESLFGDFDHHLAVVSKSGVV